MALRPYEVMFIIDTSLDDAVIQSVIDRSIDQMKALGGTVGRVEKWGRRKLAYEIRKKADGYYVLVEVTGDPAKMADLDRSMFLADEILRHKILKVPAVGAGRSLAQPPALEDIASGGGRDRDRD